MNRAQALQRLRQIGADFFTTNDVAAALGTDANTANKTASRLAANGLLVHLARGHWSLSGEVNPLGLAEELAAPYPAYISLQSALFHYGIISQIPQVIYAVTLGKTRRWSTPLGVVSLHQLAPDFFFGYEASGPNGTQMAIPEKALLDVFYLTQGRSRLFASLPEAELPTGFSKRKMSEIIARIRDPRRQLLVQRRWRKLCANS